mgnify:CR=1 FL=1
MEYTSKQIEQIAEIAKTYGEVFVFSKLIEEGIDPVTNAKRCLVAIGNYRRLVPKEIRERLAIRVTSLEESCKREREGILVKG